MSFNFKVNNIVIRPKGGVNFGGKRFEEVPVNFTTYGTPSHDYSNTIFVGHGFSCNTEVHSWWSTFMDNIDLTKLSIVCINSLGSCRGSLSPDSINPNTGKPYGNDFPNITVSDSANFLKLVLNELNVKKVPLVIGASLAGFEYLQMSVIYPDLFKKVVIVGAVKIPRRMYILYELQRHLLKMSVPHSSLSPMSLSRIISRMTYTSDSALSENDMTRDQTFHRFLEDSIEFNTRFSPLSFERLLGVVTSFKINGRYFSDLSTDQVLSMRNIEYLLVSMKDDILTPRTDIAELHSAMKKRGLNAYHEPMDSRFGHESWIIEGKKFYETIRNFLEK